MNAAKTYALTFGGAFVVSLLVTLCVRTLARRFGWVARPRPDRWHRKPTALYGGIGIWAGFVAAYLANRPAEVDGDAVLVLCATGTFVLGLVDDRFQLKPYAKVIGQIACATALIANGLRLHWLPNAILDSGLTIFWLVGITNALNLLDNIDGAAGGIAAIGAAYLLYFADAQGLTGAARLAAAFGGGVCGFLVFNVNPASIFMGDSGSLFLGFFVGGMALVNTSVPGARRNMLGVLAVPVLLLLMPILDTTLVTISRRYHGRAVSQGGRDHTSHRLVALGLSERSATFTLWAIAAAGGGLAVFVREASTLIAVLLVGTFAMALLFMMVFLGRVRVYEKIDSAHESNGRTLLPTLADFSYKRRVFETLNDLALIILCYYGSFILRFDFDGDVAQQFLPQFIRSLPVVIVVQLSSFLGAGLYRGVWRYTGVDDLVRIVRAVTAAVVLSTMAILFTFRFEGYSRAVVVMDALLLLLGVAGSRLSFRMFHDWLIARRPQEGKRALIYGAGAGGELLLRELKSNHELGWVPVGFVDDDPQKAGRLIHGVPVVGALDDLPSLIISSKVAVVLASTGKIEAARWSRVEQTCRDGGLNCRRMRITFD